jgi:hypothetical protein
VSFEPINAFDTIEKEYLIIDYDPEIIKYLFHEFYQGSNIERDRRKGLGLGLDKPKDLVTDQWANKNSGGSGGSSGLGLGLLGLFGKVFSGSAKPGVTPGVNPGVKPGVTPGVNPGVNPGVKPGVKAGGKLTSAGKMLGKFAVPLTGAIAGYDRYNEVKDDKNLTNTQKTTKVGMDTFL